jgi:ferredoxin
MSDVEIKFEREGRDGIVAVGTYVLDAMKRFGIRPSEVCVEGAHSCTVTITEGADLLSPRTEAEKTFLADAPEGERLACEAKIERPGAITVMTKEEKKADASEESSTPVDFKKEFAEMPLEKKIANLVQLEAIALGDTFSFIANSPYLIFDKIGDIMAEFGMKLERESKAATRPKEHTQAAEANDTSSSSEESESVVAASPAEDDTSKAE